MCPVNKFRMKVSKRRGLCVCFAQAQKTDTEGMGEDEKEKFGFTWKNEQEFGPYVRPAQRLGLRNVNLCDIG